VFTGVSLNWFVTVKIYKRPSWISEWKSTDGPQQVFHDWTNTEKRRKPFLYNSNVSHSKTSSSSSFLLNIFASIVPVTRRKKVRSDPLAHKQLLLLLVPTAFFFFALSSPLPLAKMYEWMDE
jgi:hypothetical protein